MVDSSICGVLVCCCYWSLHLLYDRHNFYVNEFWTANDATMPATAIIHECQFFVCLLLFHMRARASLPSTAEKVIFFCSCFYIQLWHFFFVPPHQIDAFPCEMGPWNPVVRRNDFRNLSTKIVGKQIFWISDVLYEVLIMWTESIKKNCTTARKWNYHR